MQPVQPVLTLNVPPGRIVQFRYLCYLERYPVPCYLDDWQANHLAPQPSNMNEKGRMEIGPMDLDVPSTYLGRYVENRWTRLGADRVARVVRKKSRLSNMRRLRNKARRQVANCRWEEI